MGIGAISSQNNLARSIKAADVHTWQHTGPVLDAEKPHSRRNSPRKFTSTLSVIVKKKNKNKGKQRKCPFSGEEKVKVGLHSYNSNLLILY